MNPVRCFSFQKFKRKAIHLPGIIKKMQEQQEISNGVNELLETIEKILERVRTKEERDEVSLAVESIGGSAYTPKGIGTEDILKMRMPYRFSRFLEEVTQSWAPEKGADDWAEFLRDLKKKLGAMEILKIDLGVEPNEELISQIHSWVHRELGGGIVLDIHSDKTILGGIRAIYRGRYITLTLKDRILETMNRDKQKILEKIGYKP